ncbi:ABC transporter ATP-binding protein [Paenibacillus sp. F411]|uniref:ABC transporter ATP-binding protein n=1 Tax=unclassified Paenibacillus TaxID=185978 RepID=UPI001AAEC001|nr:ABC transporter ATP-binding protein [Paenibacillus sp. F411]MBO2944161.1 ABC transporter ATP-binding protein [Paenibacillus sp. F411]
MLLSIEHISKQYGNNQALSDVSLQIKPGMFGLLGPNGAGKSTLMRILATLIDCSEGTVSYNEIRWSNKREVQRLIGYLPQHFSLFKNVKVMELLQHIAILKQVEDYKRKIIEISEHVNLTEQLHKKVGALSGGMLRRLGIAQALLGNPRILIVDEPTAGLDPEERIRFRRLLRGLSKDNIVIISTHIVEDVVAVCDEVAVLHKGKLLVTGEINNVAAIAQGKVWKKELDKETYYRESEHIEVISTESEGGKFIIKFLSDKPVEGAYQVNAGLEEGYLYLMGKQTNS